VRRAAALGLATLAVGIAPAGCGGGDGGGDKAAGPRAAKSESGVRAAAVAYTQALIAKRYAAACAVLTDAAAGQISGTGKREGCATGLGRAMSRVPPAQLQRVARGAATVAVQVKGDTATSAPVPGGSPRGGHYRYLDGRWFVADQQGR
jgi:hypothetical protein